MEKPKKVALNVTIDEDLKDWLKKAAVRRRMSVAAIVQDMVLNARRAEGGK